jgi:hypothetical protein
MPSDRRLASTTDQVPARSHMGSLPARTHTGRLQARRHTEHLRARTHMGLPPAPNTGRIPAILEGFVDVLGR